MADDKDVYHYDGGRSGISAFLGMVFGVVLMVGLIAAFAHNWGDDTGSGSKVSINIPTIPGTPAAPPTPAPAPAPSTSGRASGQ